MSAQAVYTEWLPRKARRAGRAPCAASHLATAGAAAAVALLLSAPVSAQRADLPAGDAPAGAEQPGVEPDGADLPGVDAPAADWVALFNGRDLDGWIPKVRREPVGENFRETFRVEDGLLTVGYDGYASFEDRFGHLFYAEPFSHYRLRIEYRFVGEQATGAPDWAIRNSGVMVHAQPPQTMLRDQDFPISVEVQFLGGLGDGNARPTGNMCSPGTHVVHAGALAETHCIDSDSPTFDGDQWVLSETLVLGGERIVHFINGSRVIEYGGIATGGGVVSGHDPALKPEGAPLTSGYIALQSEGHPIQFRRVELLDLTGCRDQAAANYRPYVVETVPDRCRYANER